MYNITVYNTTIKALPYWMRQERLQLSTVKDRKARQALQPQLQMRKSRGGKMVEDGLWKIRVRRWREGEGEYVKRVSEIEESEDG
jgi:hypothetical protein